MSRMTRILFYTMLLSVVLFGKGYVSAQSVPNASSPVCAYCGTRLPYGTHSSSCPYSKSTGTKPATPKSGSKSHHHAPSMKAVMAGALFESLLTSVFASDPADTRQAQQMAAELAAQRNAEWQRAQEAKAQAEFEGMMKSYKQLDGPGAAFKTLSDSALSLKSLDGDAEKLAANARKPFDTPAETTGADSGTATGGSGTPFFGDTMPDADLQLLVNPENDPNVVDLRKAVKYVAENIKNTPPAATAKTTDGTAKGEPIVRPPECDKLSLRLNSYLGQRNKFHKTILLAQDQLQVWETANRNALLNAAKDGLEYFTGELLESVSRRGEAADRLQRIYQKNAKQMAKDGVNTAALEAKIKRLRALSSAGRLSDLTSNGMDWQTFIKDGTSGLLNQLTSSNQEVQDMLRDPKLEKYFQTEAPELNALLDISKIAASNKVFGKWVARKVPIIAGVELAITAVYDGLDWGTSFYRLAKAHQINGGVMDAAKYLQKNIDNTYIALKECR
jgi:hypothetical protein